MEDGAERPVVARICELVGHMPLAVELTAAWIRVLTCEEIAAEIEQAFGALLLSAICDLSDLARCATSVHITR